MRHLLLFVTLVSIQSAWASDIGFNNLNKSEFKDIIEDFGAAYTHTAVSGASSLGTIFGFEVGVIAGASKTPAVDKFSKEFDANSEVESLPHAALFGAITFPLGITGEINFLPEIQSSELDFKTGSLAVKWTPTDIFGELPVEMSVKFHTATTDVTWKQTVASTPASMSYEQTSSGLLFQVSKKFMVLEPYFNIGTIKTTGELSSSTGSVFDASYTTSSSSEEEVSGMIVQAGVNFNLLVIRLGAEVGKIMDNGRASLKASLYF